MEKIEITLTAHNMGAECDEMDFDAWATWVAENIATDLGIDECRIEIDQHDYRGGPALDSVSGGSDEEQASIREYLSHSGWERFCATPEAWPKHNS